MKGILAHEFTHLFAMEKTSSTKILGDDNVNMRIQAWLNEGFAEILRYQTTGKKQELEDALACFHAGNKSFTFRHINASLDGLTSKERAEAFKLATAFVWALAKNAGIQHVFDNLIDIGVLYHSDNICLPD
jgi:hypothetical protein